MQTKNIHKLPKKSSQRFSCRVNLGGVSVKVVGSLAEVMGAVRVALQANQKECA